MNPREDTTNEISPLSSQAALPKASLKNRLRIQRVDNIGLDIRPQVRKDVKPPKRHHFP